MQVRAAERLVGIYVGNEGMDNSKGGLVSKGGDNLHSSLARKSRVMSFLAGPVVLHLCRKAKA